MAEAVTPTVETEHKLRRAVGPWGSYAWGYADVGADIYVALGLVIAVAGGAANIAFLFAGLIYVTVGLAYTELSSMYPLAGGGQLWVMRGLGDIWGFTAGWSVLLAFTVDIALFAFVSVSYINRFLPAILNHAPWVILEAIVLVLLLLALNARGVRESSRLNEIVGALDVFTESVLIFIGFIFAFSPSFYSHQVGSFFAHPDPARLLYGITLAIISFVGLESISQAAQETERPTAVLPRTSVALILTILAYALALSNLSLGVIPWQSFDPNSTQPQFCGHLAHGACSALHLEHQNAPMVWLSSNIPAIGVGLSLIIAALGATLLLISSNSGVYGSSRIVFSMATNDLMPKFFTYVHPRFRTPLVALVVFCAVAIGELIVTGLDPKGNVLETLAQMYAFSAAVNYLLVFIALLRLRFKDPDTPRTFRVPWNVPVRRPGQTYQVPIVGVIGALLLVAVLMLVIKYNNVGRIAGPIWVLAGFVFFYVYRRRRGLPIWTSIPRDWPREQLEVYREAGEIGLAEEYEAALRRRERLRKIEEPSKPAGPQAGGP